MVSVRPAKTTLGEVKIETSIRPYTINSFAAEDEAKRRFIKLFADNFFSSLEEDQEYKIVKAISEKLNTKSKDFLLAGLRSSMSFDFVRSSKSRFQVIFKIKLNKIKDSFANGLDNAVLAEARRQADGSLPLKLIGEMNDLSGDLAWSFILDTNTNTISFVKPVNGHRRDANKRLVELVNQNLKALEPPSEPPVEVFKNDK